jgi:hypothetical protein
MSRWRLDLTMLGSAKPPAYTCTTNALSFPTIT